MKDAIQAFLIGCAIAGIFGIVLTFFKIGLEALCIIKGCPITNGGY